MGGILDNKSRVLDTILTLEGRRQLSQGGVDVSYVSFSDSTTFYKADIQSGSQDATQRIYFEACQLPQDQVTFRADDAGNVLPFSNADGIPQSPGKILAYTYSGVSGTIIGGDQNVAASQGNSFSDLTGQLLGNSLGNFNKLMVVATHDMTFEDDGFAAGPSDITFTLNSNRPISDPDLYSTHVTSLDSIFSDPRFSHMPNFAYLPPVNKTTGNLDDFDAMAKSQLATYPTLGASTVASLTYAQIKNELGYYESLGYMRQISFDPTSLKNNVFGQFFEKNYDTLRKLDVVDFGMHRTGDRSAPTSHIYFVGKVMIDEKGSDTFIHLFTLVFE
jgi:hypothetical protein